MRIETEHGQVVFSRPSGEQLLRHFTARWRMPVVSLETDGDRGAAYGVVFQVGADEAWCFLHTLPPEVGSEIEVVLGLLQKGMSEALARLTEWRPPGVLLPCACLIDSGDGTMTPGMAVFTSDALGPDVDGPTYSELVSAFVDLLSTTSAGVMLPPFTAVNRVPRLAAGAIKFDTALVDGAPLCFRVEPEDPLDEEEQRELSGIWAHAGVKHIAWAPAIPIFLSDEEASMLHGPDDEPDVDDVHAAEPATVAQEPATNEADRDAVEPPVRGESPRPISMQTPTMAPVESGAHKEADTSAGLSAAWGPTQLDFSEQARTTADRETLIRLRGETLSADEEEARRAAAAAVAIAEGREPIIRFEEAVPATEGGAQTHEPIGDAHHVAVVESGYEDDIAGFETLDASTAGDLIAGARGEFGALNKAAASSGTRLIPELSDATRVDDSPKSPPPAQPAPTSGSPDAAADRHPSGGDPKKSDFDNTLVGAGVESEKAQWDVPTADALVESSAATGPRGNTDGYKPFDASGAPEPDVDADRIAVASVSQHWLEGAERFAKIATSPWADVHDFAGDRGHAGVIAAALRVLLAAGTWPDWLPETDEIRRAGAAIACFHRDRLEALLDVRLARGVDPVELARLRLTHQPKQAIVCGVDRVDAAAVSDGWATRQLDDLARLAAAAAEADPDTAALTSYRAFLAELVICRDLFRHDALADATPWEDALRRSPLRGVLLQTLHHDVVSRVVAELRSHGWTALDPDAVAAGTPPQARSFACRVDARGGHVRTEVTIVDPESPHCYGVRAGGGRVLIFAEAFDKATTGVEATLAWGRRNEFLRDLCAVLQIDTTHIEGQATEPTRAVEVDALGVLRADARQTLAQTLIETAWVLWRRTHKGRFARR